MIPCRMGPERPLFSLLPPPAALEPKTHAQRIREPFGSCLGCEALLREHRFGVAVQARGTPGRQFVYLTNQVTGRSRDLKGLIGVADTRASISGSASKHFPSLACRQRPRFYWRYLPDRDRSVLGVAQLA